MTIVKPTTDFVSTTFDVALAQGETGSITAKIGTGLSIPATNSYLQVDYNSTAGVGSADGPETIFYATYNSGTGALTGVVRGQQGTTDVAHSAGAEVQCGMTTGYLEDNTGWKTVKDTWTYASSTTITVPSGAASTYSVGDKIKLTQTTAKYFSVTAVADTLLTVTGGTDYTVANAAITSPYYSKAVSPVGFPTWFSFTPTITFTATGNPGTPTLNSKFAVSGSKCTYTFWASYGSAGNAVTRADVTFPISVVSGYFGAGVSAAATLTPVLAFSQVTTTTMNIFFSSAAIDRFGFSITYPI